MGAYLNSNGAVDKHTSSSTSFFSRIPKIPWRIRTPSRQVADFHVRPNEPHRQYAAGDHVHGAVILTVVKNLRITHLTVALHGYVRAYKGPAIAERELTSPIINGRSEAQYHGNGYASLFQDEIVLAGEGKLEASKYQFEFDLQLPEKGLPSSIDFERGTISYMITATLTLPGPMSPTRTYDRKITLTEKIDIGILARPRPRTIYLEPIPKKSKKKRQTGSERALANNSDTIDHVSDRESTIEQSVISEDAVHDSNELARSPVQQDVRSEISGDSVTSGSNLSDRGPELQTASALAANAKLQAVDEKTITATIELLKGGALAGDMATVKVSVQHIKRLKSMHGVIVTLYRQGRIDTAPPASLFKDMVSKDDARKLQKDEYYPRSRTGLGGLSLSSASSQSVFRKDLSQTIAPLIVDPATMETTVTASVKVPEDAFPTIKNVPGDMISFKYQMEVLVDLGGRLTGHLQGGNQARGGGYAPGPAVADGNSYMSRGGSVIDTDRLRREKGVICVHFELILGTVDSTRGRKQSNTFRTYQLQEEEGVSQEEIISPWSEEMMDGDDGSGYWPQPTPTGGGNAPPLSQQPTDSEAATAHRPQEQAPAYVPPPEMTDESTLTEKERARRQEERLLPSQPPGAEEEEAGPSAPTAPASEPNIHDADEEPPPPPSAEATAPPAQPAAASDDDAVPSAPTLDDIAAGRSAGPTDDKLELERQRLLNEASAPPEFPDDCEAGPSSRGLGGGPSAPPDAAVAGTGGGDAEPSAPVLMDEDEYGGQYSYHAETGGGAASSSRGHGHDGDGHEPLPRYER